MTKKQKVWLSIFSLMFLVPEILYNPIGNVLYSLVQDGNHIKTLGLINIDFSKNITSVLFLLFIQFLGALGSIILTRKSNIVNITKITLVSLFFVLLVTTGFAFYVVFSLRHGIGF